jgi:FkbM family methyltransferase
MSLDSLGRGLNLLPFRSVRGHTLLLGRLEEPIVIDAGSNRGEFSQELSALVGGAYSMYEANPDLAAATPTPVGMSITHAAIAAADGMTTLNLARNDEGSSLLPLPEISEYDCVSIGEATVPTVSLDRVLRNTRGTVDLIKMDIEGSEVEALGTVDLADLESRVGQITVEFHSAAIFGFDIEADVSAVIERMRRAGFVVLDFSSDRTDVLFLNRRLLRLGPRECAAYQLWTERGYPVVLWKRDIQRRSRERLSISKRRVMAARAARRSATPSR